VCFQSGYESAQGVRIADGSRYIVRGSRCGDSKGMLVEVRRGVRSVQCCSGARAQCPRWLVSVQLTCKVSRCTRVDGSKRNCPELEVDTLPQLSGTGTTWCLSDHTGERVLDTLRAVEVALGGAVEKAVTVVKTRTDG